MPEPYSDVDGYDAIQDYRAEREPYLHHRLSYREVMTGLFPDAVSRPVRRDDSEASTPLPDASGSPTPTDLQAA